MSGDFVHLHLHTHYSMLDGACTAAGIVELAKEYGMTAAAITDHGYVGGAEEFHRVLEEAGLKGIVGCEAYMAPGSRLDKSPGTDFIKGFHLVLLCENVTGYHSLCKLISEAYRTGFYYKPRIDKELLRQYHEGLIGLSACIAGEIPERIRQNDMKAARAALEEYIDIFGKENFFIELMDHGMEEEKQVMKPLIDLAREYGVGLVATNDAHYLRKEDAEAHEIMLCIQTGALLSDERHMKFSGPEYYVKSPEEMKAIFADVPEAIENTVKIADRCSMEFDYKTNHYPVFYLPDGSVPDKNTLRAICVGRLPERYGFEYDPDDESKLTPAQREIIERMDYELGIIERTGFCSYFMVVSDFIVYAKDHGIPVGPGRGSGAGSLVAYLMKITDIDPLRYGLLFERFLNPDRVSPPDFDIDFCEKRRGEVIEYVRQRYGFDSVAQICTYGQLKAKAVVKDVARVLGLGFDEGNRLTKMIPDDLKVTIKSALEQSEELKAAVAADPKVAEVIRLAKPLEGLNRQAGVHAAGVIIGDQRLDNLVPLSRSAQGDMVVQYPKEPCEHLGLLKMDFLGLRTLTIIRNACDLIKEQHGVDIDLARLPLDDAKTFEMLRRGDTVAVFQLESAPMQNLCRTFGVETIEHLIALIALYRPGPMRFIPDFVARKKGLQQIVYDHPKMERYLKETYGIMVYQEQIMQVVQALAGYSLGGADILRRAIAKKKEKEMKKQHEIFIKGCAEHNNIPTALAEQIWEKINLFAGYGFNKSHSAAYGFVSYQTAYLKANYPVEFMAAVLTSEIENSEKLAFLIGACREMGIKVLPPDINSSAISFSVDKGRIRFGLGAIKGVGEAAAGRIIEGRKSDGEYTSFLDFCERCGSDLNSRMLEYLIRAGALDGLGLRRSQLLATADEMISFAAERARDKAAGQGSLFDLLDGGEGESGVCDIPVPDIPEFEWSEILKSEKELLGFYVSGHPLDPDRALLAYGTPLRELADLPDNSPVRLAGMIDTYALKFGKNSGKQFGVLKLEDIDASCEMMLYERALGAVAKAGIPMLPGTPVLVEATVSRRDEGEAPRVMVDRVLPLADAPEKFTRSLYLYYYQDKVAPSCVQELSKSFRRLPDGKAQVILCVVRKDDSVVYIEAGREVTVTREFLADAERLLGRGKLKIVPTELPPPRPRWNRENAEKANGANADASSGD